MYSHSNRQFILTLLMVHRFITNLASSSASDVTTQSSLFFGECCNFQYFFCALSTVCLNFFYLYWEQKSERLLVCACVCNRLEQFSRTGIERELKEMNEFTEHFLKALPRDFSCLSHAVQNSCGLTEDQYFPFLNLQSIDSRKCDGGTLLDKQHRSLGCFVVTGLSCFYIQRSVSSGLHPEVISNM